MKDYQNDLRHLRCFLFIVRTVFSLPCLVLLTAEEDACNEEGGGSGEGEKVFSLCRRNAVQKERRGEERRAQ